MKLIEKIRSDAGYDKKTDAPIYVEIQVVTGVCFKGELGVHDGVILLHREAGVIYINPDHIVSAMFWP